MSKILIVEATEAMCSELSKVKKQVWKTTYTGIYPDDQINNFNLIEHENKFKNYIKCDYLKLFAVFLENKIIGYTAVGKSPHRLNSPNLEIVLLYILKKHQGKGFGKQVFEFAKNIIKNSNKTSFYVCCNKYNLPAQQFYQKMGCKTVKIDEDNEDLSLPQITYIYKF